MKKRVFLLSVWIILALSIFALPVHAQDCRDASGAPIACPEKEKKRKPTNTALPPTATFTPTQTPTTTPTVTQTPTNTLTPTSTATSISAPLFSFLAPAETEEGKLPPWGIWGIGAGLLALAGFTVNRLSRLRFQPPPEPKNYYEEPLSARGSMTPEPKDFPDQPGGRDGEQESPPGIHKTGERVFFVDEDQIGTLHPDPGNERGDDSDDDDPDMPEI